MEIFLLKSSTQPITGIGLHTGQKSTVTLKPNDKQGVRLYREEKPIQLRAQAVFNTALCTEIGTPEHSIKTIEHLFAALHGMRVSDVDIHVIGEEIPILDGSALPWVEAFEAAGLVPIEMRDDLIFQPKNQNVELENGTATVASAEDLILSLTFSFPLPGMEALEASYTITPEIFKAQIAPARTFCRKEDIEPMQAAGLIKGGSLDSACVFNPDGSVVNPEGLRFADEPLRHKILDLLGDLYVNGCILQGEFHVPHAGHSVNNQFLRKIL